MKIFVTILKYLGIGATSLGILYGAFSLLDNIRDDISDIKDTQTEYRSTADTILNIARSYEDRIKIVEQAVQYNEGQSQVIRESYMRHLSHDESLTKEEFMEYMDPFLEYIKKNSTPTQSRSSTQSMGEGISEEIIPGNTTLSSSR